MIKHRTFAHESAIYALDVDPKSNLIVSGGLDGTIILWRLQ